MRTLLLLLLSIGLIAEDLHREMHNELAGAILPTGWYLCDSTGGGFSVETPTPCGDYSVRDSESAMRAYVLGARVQGGSQYAVTKIAGSNGKPLDEVEKGFQIRDPNGRKTVSDMKVLGATGSHITIIDGQRYADILMVKVPDAVFTVVVEGTPEDATSIDATFDHLTQTLKAK
jgi:hypothetical protein